MNTITKAMTEMSPRTSGQRLAGAFYLVTILTGVFAQGLSARLLSCPATPRRPRTYILSHDGLFRLGFAVYMIEMVCQIITTVLLYDLLKPRQPERVVAGGGPGSSAAASRPSVASSTLRRARTRRHAPTSVYSAANNWTPSPSLPQGGGMTSGPESRWCSSASTHS